MTRLGRQSPQPRSFIHLSTENRLPECLTAVTDRSSIELSSHAGLPVQDEAARLLLEPDGR
jgi:hypothetical protein